MGLALAGAAAAQAATPAGGGERLLDGADAAESVVAGTIASPRQLDASGWRADLRVERVLFGPAEAGDTLVVGWEELAPSRPPRFAEGQRVLVALDPQPDGSLWRSRFPRGGARVVAQRGEAFLRDPDPGTLDTLAGWLAVPREHRDTKFGARELVPLVARAAPPLAFSALARLETMAALAPGLAADGQVALSVAIRDPRRPLALRRATLELVGRRRLAALRPLVVDLADRPSELRAAALDALGLLDDGLSAERTRDALASDDGAVRAAALRRGAAALSSGELRARLAEDPDGAVRAEAVTALIARDGAGALPAAVAALGADPDPQVRQAAARACGGLGAAAVPALRDAIWAPGATPDGVAGPMAALAVAGPEGVAELQRTAHEHPRADVRGVARLLLGRDPHDPH